MSVFETRDRTTARAFGVVSNTGRLGWRLITQTPAPIKYRMDKKLDGWITEEACPRDPPKEEDQALRISRRSRGWDYDEAFIERLFAEGWQRRITEWGSIWERSGCANDEVHAVRIDQDMDA